MAVSSNPADTIISYSLGSCLGLSVFDPVTRVGGLVHCLMPLSKMNVQKAEKCPHMFVDTGVASLLEAVLAKGGRKKDLVVCAAGACRLLDETQAFNIGERNYTVLRKILWKNRIMIAAEEVGGMTPRTILLRIDSGRTFIRSGGEERELRAAESGNRAARIAIPATGTDRT